MIRDTPDRETILTKPTSADTAVCPKFVLSIIIVNFRTPDLTIDCLNSVASDIGDQSTVRVFVVENGSADDSGRAISQKIESAGWQSWCSLILSSENLGFSGGNNYGISASQNAGHSKYVLLLNSDTIVQPGCLASCISIMDNDSTIGALSCRLVNADGSIQNVCRRFPTPLRCLVAQSSLPWRFPKWFSWADCDDLGWDRNRLARDVEWIGGAFMMLRGDWIARHKALDDRFFFYGEDVELCHRVWRTGLRCHYSPTSTVIHLGGASSDPSRMTGGARNFHQWRGRYLIQEICYGYVAKIFLQCIDLLALSLRIVRAWCLRRTNTAEYTERLAILRFLARNWSVWDQNGV